MADQPTQGHNLKVMLKDKKLWIGAGVAGVLGLAAFLKKGGSSAAAAGPGGAPTGTTSAGAYGQGGGDTTGTNIASWLSQYQASMDASNVAYQQHLTDTVTGLLGGTSGGSLTPVSASAQGGNQLGQWLTQINSANPGLNLTSESFKTLNPSYQLAQANQYGYLGVNGNYAGKAGGGDTVDVFGSGGTFRIR